MKRIIFSFLSLMTFATVHAQQTVVIERPGIFTDLASAATALVMLPAVAATGIVEGTVEAFRDVVSGSTVVVTAPAPAVVAPAVVAPAVVAPAVVAPAVVAPATVAPAVIAPAPAVVPSTTIITRHRDGSVTSVTRQASAYELGPNIVVPVAPEHRTGTSPYVNPYVFRYQ